MSRPTGLSPRDLLLAERLSPEQVAALLAPYGFADVAAADANIQALAPDPPARHLLAGIIDELLFNLGRSADPDQALSRFETFAAATMNRQQLYAHCQASPRTLEIAAKALGASSFMAEILVRDPGYLYWLSDPEVLTEGRDREHIRTDLDAALGALKSADRKRDVLRTARRKELLHIGVRDLLRLASVEDTLARLSDLAEALIDKAYELAAEAVAPGAPRRGFVVIGLGKLGGGELNFSSDVDLMYVYAPGGAEDARRHEAVARAVTAALADATNEGYVYRVDLRLRPDGKMGAIAHSLEAARGYYESRGETWERLALLKAWPVGGDRRLGVRFRRLARSFAYGASFDAEAFRRVRGMKEQIDAKVSRRGESRRDVKLGVGGIREIEFVAQARQARAGPRCAAARTRGTLPALGALATEGHVTADEHRLLSEAYVFLRDLENKLQMAADAQVHAMPSDPAALRVLARAMGYEDQDAGAGARLLSDHARHTEAVHRVFEETFAAKG